MANPKVSDKTKANIQKKMVEYGVSEDEVYAEASDKTFVDRINDCLLYTSGNPLRL